MDRMEDKLDSLFAEYRDACPDPEASANFMPQLWQRIETRRSSTFSLLLRRWAEVCILATLTLTLLMSAYLIPRYQRQPVYQSTYVDVLAGTLDYTTVLPGGEGQ
jgi:anti-sigma-K factor RskA